MLIHACVHTRMHAACLHTAQGKAEVEALPIDSIKRIRECYKQMRAVYSAAGLEAQSQVRPRSHIMIGHLTK